MYSLISAEDALKKPMDKPDIGNCQDASMFEIAMVHDRILICNYSLDFPFGISSIDKVVSTVKSLSAVGVVMVLAPALVSYSNSLPTTTFPVPGAASAVKNATGIRCTSDGGMPTDLNLPSITIASLVTKRTFPRQVTNIAGTSHPRLVQRLNSAISG